MAGGQCRGLQSRPPACLDIPSMTVDQFQHLRPSFEAAIQAVLRIYYISPPRKGFSPSSTGLHELHSPGH